MDLSTHVVYGFAVLDPSDLIIKPHDSWADLDNGEFDFNKACDYINMCKKVC